MDVLLSIVTSALWVVLALTILVFVHELGHFLTAKYFGMRVERFSVGFPPTIFGRRYGDTEYAIGATPLGGYVKISGMIDESMDTDHVEKEPEPWEFRAKPVWQRIIVISAGVIFNIFLAILIFGGIRWVEGDTYIPAQNIEQVYVQEGSVAHDMGLRTGDHILQVNGKRFERFDQIASSSIVTADTLTVTVRRDGQTKRIVGPPDIITRLSRAQNNNEGFGIGYIPPLIGGVQSGSPADSIGIRPGDRILAIGQDTVRFWPEMSALIQKTEGAPVTFRWRRADSLAAADTATGVARVVRRTGEGVVFEATAAPMHDESDGRYLLGVRSPGASPGTQQMLYDEFESRRCRTGPARRSWAA